MKKLLALLLAILLALALVACGTTDADDDDDDDKSKDKIEQKDDDEEDEEDEEKEDKKDKKDKIKFEEIVVVDNDECVIKITKLDPDNDWGYTIKAYLENKSDSVTYSYNIYTASINNVEVDPYFYAEIEPGKKANEEITFDETYLAENGIEKYTDIELTFHVSDAENWDAENVAEETVHIYPYGEDKAETFVRETQDTDTVVVDNDDVTFIVTGYDPDGDWGYTVNIYLVNKTDKEIMIGTDNVSVNGFMLDPFFGKSIAPGKTLFDKMYWSNEDLEDNDIDEVTEIEFELTVSDYNDWSAEDIYNQVVVLNP